MTVRSRAATAVGLALAAGAAWEAQRRVDRRRTEADPEYDFLFTRVDGRPSSVTAPDGTVLHVETYGPEDAPTIVFAHGWTCSNQFWKYQLRDLAADWRIVAYDQRGHARSAAAASGDYSIEALARDLQAVLEASVPAGQRALVAGHSLGGMTIGAWAGLHPDEVARRAAAVALVDTGMDHLIGDSTVVPSPKAMAPVKEAVGHLMLNFDASFGTTPTPLSRRVVHRIALGPGASPAQVGFCERLTLDCPRATRVALGETLAALDVCPSLERITVPSMVIVGTSDRLTPPVHAHRMAATITGPCEIVELPRIGHMSAFEAPGEVTANLRRLAEANLRADTVAAPPAELSASA